MVTSLLQPFMGWVRPRVGSSVPLARHLPVGHACVRGPGHGSTAIPEPGSAPNREPATSVGTPPGAAAGGSRPILPGRLPSTTNPPTPRAPGTHTCGWRRPAFSGPRGRQLTARLPLAGGPALLPVLRRNCWCHVRPEGRRVAQSFAYGAECAVGWTGRKHERGALPPPTNVPSALWAPLLGAPPARQRPLLARTPLPSC